MSSNCQLPIIATIWRYKDITSSVFEAVGRAGARAIFDVSSVDLSSAASAILRADISSHSADLKISPSQLLDQGLEEFLEEIGITGIWVELHPALLEKDAGVYLDRMADFPQSFRCCPVVGDVDLIAQIVSRADAFPYIGLKGSEAAGFVSSENTFTLYSVVRHMVGSLPNQPNLFVWGGIATPEAAAAFLAAGAKGVVLESLHWLTDLVSAEDAVKDKLARLRPEHTDLAGLTLQVPCRLFNRGNSRAVRSLKDFSKSLCGEEITREQQRDFAARIQADSLQPLESSFSADELLPLGVEAAFARSFVDRFGSSTEQALNGFITETERLCKHASEKEKTFIQSDIAREMGTKYPFVQGAMSWITDVPEFAAKVAEAGALPTIALGMMPKDILDLKLGSLREIIGDRPFAVNVITLQENPHRDEQLAWIRSLKPRFAVIAAGDPSHARELLDQGIDVIYIAPNEELLRLAFEAGVRYVICEGNEAGGHVGEHSTLTLSQMVQELKRKDPALFEGRRIILAGGVCNRETAFMAAMLGADAVQMGTCYLTCKEIVESGALTALYQRMILESKPGSTAVTGERTGLRVRSLRTGKIEAICSLERDFGDGSEDEASFRRRMEQLSAGSLFIAARGLDRPGGTPVDDATCMEQGQFMSGACAGSLNHIRTLDQLHLEFAQGALAEGLPFAGPIPRPVAGPESYYEEAVPPSRISVNERGSYRLPERERVAITGLSIVNSLGQSPEEIWAASVAMKTGIIEVPASRWNHALYYDPRPRASEKTYCKFGAFQNIEVSRKELGIPPQDFRTMTDSTRVTMWLAKRAIEDSGILDSDIPRERISVLCSQNSGEAAATLEDVIVRTAADSIIESIKSVISLSEENAMAIQEAVKANRIAIDDTTLLGRLNCTSGGFICNKFGFQGPSFAVSAASATALVALYSAYQMIRNGIIDAAVVGGAEEPLTPMHFLEFSALGALAGISGVDRPADRASRPFDMNRDGMVLGEGGAMIVVERESVALRRGARIYGYITGMGASNNHLGVVESSKITQEIAIGASLKDTYYGADEVDLVECHATSTIQGDVEEVLALQRFYNSHSHTVLCSFKSQIGHTLGASGLNSMIRGIMAMNAGILPATLNCDSPDPALHLETSGLRILSEPEEWKVGNGRPRRLEVNAFGFGGSNYVVQLEEAVDSHGIVLVRPDNARYDTEPPSLEPLVEGVHAFGTEIGGERYRVAVVAESEERAVSLINETAPVRGASEINSKYLRGLSKQGIYLGSERDEIPPTAFVFTGQGSHYQGMGLDLYRTFPVIREWMDRAASVAEFDLLHLMFHDTEEDLQKTRWQQPALFTLEFAIAQHLISLGIEPTAMAGHSLGELTALCLAGVYSFEDGFRVVNMRAICMDKACEINTDPGVMMAVDAPLEYLEEKLHGRDKIFITNINSPRQVVLGGDTEAVKAFGEDLKKQGYRRTLLRVSMAFHSPIMRCIHDELDAFIKDIPFHAPKIPVISNTTMEPFPADTTEIKKIVMAHLESPVHWMQNTRTLWKDYDVRLFLEIGPRDILSNMIKDTIEQAECIHTALQSAESATYRSAVAQLYAKGCFQTKHRARPVVFPGQEISVRASVTVPAPAYRGPAAPARPPQGIDPVIFDKIVGFVRDGFGRFLKPALHDAIKREHDPKFTESDLDSILGILFPAIAGQPLPAPRLTQSPADRAGEIQSDPLARVEDKKAVSEVDEITETVIGIIVDATGYDREEIDPQMDLREDLSIRSSRLPIIMEALESHFSTKINLEDFMEVRTVGGIADKLREILGVEKKPAAEVPQKPRPAEEPSSEQPKPERAEKRKPLRRVVFKDVPLPLSAIQLVELAATDSVIVASATAANGLSDQLAKVFQTDYRVNVVPLAFLEDNSGRSQPSFDLRKPIEPEKMAEAIHNVVSPAGLVFAIDDLADQRLSRVDELPQVLTGCFALAKALLESAEKKFVTLVHRTAKPDSMAVLLVEGLLGMMLSLGHEYPSVQFRTISVDDRTDLRAAVRLALDRGQKVVETAFRGGQAFTTEGQPVPLSWHGSDNFEVSTEDVVVFSGGGRGITTYLARNLAPFGCKIVFLGRTELDPRIDYQKLLQSGDNAQKAIRDAIVPLDPSMSSQGLESRAAEELKALDIVRNVEYLRAAGIDASYYRCDVTDSEQTRRVMSQIVKRYGKIDAVVHGAGIVRDNMARFMAPEDFTAVVIPKLLGAWNLFQAAEKAGLKYFACLSSGAAIQGNPGQANYSAGNRAMAALMRKLRSDRPSIRFKALHLPPIEGVGMADDPEIRALMKRMNADYVHVEELGALFAREMVISPVEDVSVLLMRSLPDLKSVRLQVPEIGNDAEGMEAAAVRFAKEDFPMIDSVEDIDIGKGMLRANRSVSQERDLWIADHKPFKFLKHPLVSAIMALETCMEAARVLYPALPVRGIRDAKFLDIIECPPDAVRMMEIACRRTDGSARDPVCEVSLTSREIAGMGQTVKKALANYQAKVILGFGHGLSSGRHAGFPVKKTDLDSRPMNEQEAVQWYVDRSDLKGRYRVIKDMEGSGPDAVKGRTLYRQGKDFAAEDTANYQYSPYLLEALLHVVNFYVIMRDESEKRSMIPLSIGEMLFWRRCVDGEILTLEGRLKSSDKEGLTWDARAADSRGQTVMQVRNMVMRWFSA